MKLGDYLSENDSLTVYRVIHENTDEEDQEVISRNLSAVDAPKEAIEEAYFQARDTIYDEGDTSHTIRHTEPQPYLTPVETEIADICVFASSEEKAEDRYNEELRKAEEKKKSLLKYREEKVEPFLEQLEEKTDFIGFRGDLVMPGRKATPFSDINVVLATRKEVDDILELLGESPGTVEYLDRITPAKGDRFLVEREAPVVSYDIWSTEEFREEREKDREEETYKKLYFDTMEVFHNDL